MDVNSLKAQLDRLDHVRLVCCKIFLAEKTASSRDQLYNRVCNPALVEAVWALCCNSPKGLCKVWVALSYRIL